jgi:hypothetical protein
VIRKLVQAFDRDYLLDLRDLAEEFRSIDPADPGRVVSGRYHPVPTNHGRGTGADPSRDRFGRSLANNPLDEQWSQLTSVHRLVEAQVAGTIDRVRGVASG